MHRLYGRARPRIRAAPAPSRPGPDYRLQPFSHHDPAQPPRPAHLVPGFAAAARTRQGPRQLRRGRRPHPHGGERPDLGVRRDHGRADPGQGRAADEDGAVLVRQARPPLPQPPDGRSAGKRGVARRGRAGARPLHARAAAAPDSRGGRGARLSRGQRLEGVPGHALGLRRAAARRADERVAPAAAHLHAGRQGRRGRARREHHVRAHRGDGGHRPRHEDPRHEHRAVRGRGRDRAGKGHDHCRHQVRVRPGSRRHAGADGRGAHSRQLALLARGRLRGGPGRRGRIRPATTSSSCATGWSRPR